MSSVSISLLLRRLLADRKGETLEPRRSPPDPKNIFSESSRITLNSQSGENQVKKQWHKSNTEYFVNHEVIAPVKIFREGKLVHSSNDHRKIILHQETLRVFNKSYPGQEIARLDLSEELDICYDVIDPYDSVHGVTIRSAEATIQVSFEDRQGAVHLSERLHEEYIYAKTKMNRLNASGLNKLVAMMAVVEDKVDKAVPTLLSPKDHGSLDETTPLPAAHSRFLSVPQMNIVILVVGTRGDVQPFVNLGCELMRRGHTVRLATHALYRHDVVKEGLKYYPLAGDPRKLSSYMVKTAGRLVPDILNKEEMAAIPEKMQMLRDITFSSCLHPARPRRHRARGVCGRCNHIQPRCLWTYSLR